MELPIIFNLVLVVVCGWLYLVRAKNEATIALLKNFIRSARHKQHQSITNKSLGQWRNRAGMQSHPTFTQDVGQMSVVLSELRKYARVISGSVEAADKSLIVLLHNISEQPAAQDVHGSLRLRVFKLFHHACQVAPCVANGNADTVFQQDLNAVEASSRSALLLVGWMGFSVSDAATILEISKSEVYDRLDRAACELQSRIHSRHPINA